MKTTLIFVLLTIVTVANAAVDSNNTSAAKLTSEAADNVKPAGFIPYLGFNGGYTSTDSSTPVEGLPASLKLLGSYYLTSPYVFDLGLGIANQQFTNSRAIDTGSTGTAIEAAARYNFTNNIQAGLVFNQFLGQGRDYSASQGDAQFLGVQALKEFNLGRSTLARVGGRIQTLTNNTGDAVNMFMIDLQIGYDYKAKQVSTTAVTTAEAAPKATSTVATASSTNTTATNSANTKAEPSLAAKASSELAAGKSKATTSLFALSKAELTKSDKTQLSKIAAILKKNPSLVGTIEVKGYADASGNAKANQKLSEKRAASVKSFLKTQGVKAKVVALGKGPVGNGANPDARKTELVFKNVKDEAALKKALSTIE